MTKEHSLPSQLDLAKTVPAYNSGERRGHGMHLGAARTSGSCIVLAKLTGSASDCMQSTPTVYIIYAHTKQLHWVVTSEIRSFRDILHSGNYTFTSEREVAPKGFRN